MAVALLIFVSTFALRFLSAGFTNDDYLFLAHGRQLAAFGEWPIRDLLEEGRPLHSVVSAAAQLVVGHRLIGEMVLDLSMFSAAYALTFLLGVELSGSTAIGLASAMLPLLASPRLYDYPKAILPVAALWFGFRYAARPSLTRLAALGLFTAVTFLYRHDLGVYVGAGVAGALLAMQAAGRSWSFRPFVTFGMAAAIGLLPFMVFLQTSRGILDYFEAGRRFVQRESARTRDSGPAFQFDPSKALWTVAPPPPQSAPSVGVRWAAELSADSRHELEATYGLTEGRPSGDRTWDYALQDPSAANLRSLVADPRVEDTNRIDRAGARIDPAQVPRPASLLSRITIAPGLLTRTNAVAWLSLTMHALPFIVLVMVAAPVVGIGRPMATEEIGKIVMTLTLSAVAAPLLLRGDLDRSGRLADLACPTALLLAWVLGRIRSSGPFLSQPNYRMAGGAMAIAVFAVTCAAWMKVEGVPGRELVAITTRQLATKTDDLSSTPPPLHWISGDTPGREIVAYLRRCTGPGDRVFVMGFAPEIYFFSGRAIGGDRPFVLPGFWNLADEQTRTVQRLRASNTLLAFVDGGRDDGSTRDRLFASDLPIIQAHLAGEYRQVGAVTSGVNADSRYVVWARQARTPTGSDDALGLPCYR